MTREQLVDAMAVAIHAEVCACGGTGQNVPAYYQRAARAVLRLLEREGATIPAGDPDVRR